MGDTRYKCHWYIDDEELIVFGDIFMSRFVIFPGNSIDCFHDTENYEAFMNQREKMVQGNVIGKNCQLQNHGVNYMVRI